jgi:hypothetical protein
MTLIAEHRALVVIQEIVELVAVVHLGGAGFQRVDVFGRRIGRSVPPPKAAAPEHPPSGIAGRAPLAPAFE